MNGNGEQLIPQPVSKRWKRRWQHEPVHHNVNADPVHHTRHNRMFPQKFDLPTGQVKNRCDHKRNEKMERQAEASRYQAAVVRARSQQSSRRFPAIRAGPPPPRCHQITNAEEMSKTPTTRPAVTIARNASEFFMRL